MTSFLVSSFFVRHAIGGVCAVLIAAVIWFLARRRAPVWLLGLVLFTPVVILLANPNWRLFSHHSFMHWSIVYDIFERGLPPSLPLAAGVELKYAYGFHIMVAELMKFIPVAPPWFFAGLNIFSLAGTIYVLDRIARIVFTDRRYRILAIAVMFSGCAILVGPQMAPILAKFGLPFEVRLTPLVKFGAINNNQLGMFFFAVALLGAVLLVTSRTVGWRPYALFTAGFLGSGFFYPIAWLGVCAVIGVAAIHRLWYRRSEARPQLFTILAILMVGSLLLLPWLLLTCSGRPEEASVQLFSPSALWRNVMILTGVLIIPVILMWHFRKTLLDAANHNRDVITFLLLSAIILQVLFVAISMPVRNQYKILILSQWPLGLLLGIPLFRLLESRRVLVWLLLMLFLLPASFQFAPLFVFGWPVSDEATTEARAIVPVDPAQRDLYNWIASETPVNSVFVDSYLTIPVFSRRPLFIGLDNRRANGELRGKVDGWNLPTHVLIHEVNGMDREVAERRRRLAQELLTPKAELPSAMLVQLEKECGDAPLYIVARNSRVRSRLLKTDRFALGFTNPAASVFVFIKSEDALKTSRLIGSREQHTVKKNLSLL